ncbi:HlyU family transcriptional regulator [Rhodophyticola sp.]|jgi:hypothetical protein|uniref:HlyU family transcriptional regulator n=1 Tax=Rhodophyticola sp. TaxID=2680032 RepID=UPI003D2D30FF
MSIFSKLFGGGKTGAAAPQADPIEHDGFRIFPAPVKEAGGHRIAARIEKEIDGEVKTHQMIRADLVASLDEATAISIAKARQMIKEQGDTIFGP